MLDSANKLLEEMKDIEYCEFTRLMSPLEVVVTRKGSCHDQVMYEMEELHELCLNPKAKFILAVDKDNNGLETHSFVYYEDGDRVCWFENAWKDNRGINKFLCEKDMFDRIESLFKHRTNASNLYFVDFNPDEHTIGEDIHTLVDICTDHNL